METFFNALSQKDLVTVFEGRLPALTQTSLLPVAARMGLSDTEQGDAGRIGLWVKMLMKDLGMCILG